MKILNLYCGIGGNRKLWGDDHEITAVENVKEIADIYSDLFPKDKVIVADAHQYLLEHFNEFDFIWSSPPCPTHSDIRRCGVHKGQYKAKYADMELYQEIILLQHFAPKKCKWVIENVVPYYKPMIAPFIVHRHCFWTNYVIREIEIKDDRVHCNINGSSEIYGFNLKDYKVKDKRKILRNMVNPEVGAWVFSEAYKKNKTLF